MGQTPADVRRDIEITRERMSDTLDRIERKLDVVQMVRDHPWEAIAVAVGAGLVLSQSGADRRAAAATTAAARQTSGTVGGALDAVVAALVTNVTHALHNRVDQLVGQVASAVGGSQATTPASQGAYRGGSNATRPRDGSANELRAD